MTVKLLDERPVWAQRLALLAVLIVLLALAFLSAKAWPGGHQSADATSVAWCDRLCQDESKIARATAVLKDSTLSKPARVTKALAILQEPFVPEPTTTTAPTTTAPTTTAPTTTAPTTTTVPTTTSTSTVSTPPTVAVPGSLLVSYGSGVSPIPGRYDVIDQSPGKVDQLKTAKDQSNGATLVLAYKDASVAGTIGQCGWGSYPSNPSPDWCGSVVTSTEALTHDQANPADQWILRNADGTPYLDPSYGGQYLLNLGSPSYHTVALARMRHTLTVGQAPHVIPQGYKYDGVFWDNTNPTYRDRLPSGVATLYYNGAPFTNAQWHDAQVSWAQNVTQVLRNEGFYTFCNCGAAGPGTSDQINQSDATMTWFREIGQYNDGLGYEYWENWGKTNGVNWNWINTADWRGWFDERFRAPDAAQPRNDFFSLGIGDCTQTAPQTYSRVTFLLKWDGSRHGGWGCFGSAAGAWNDAVMTWIGTPTELAQLVGTPDPTLGDKHTSHGWIRHYSDGVVILNPDEPGQTARAFNLGGSYKTPAGTFVSTVTLAPITAMILTR
jgi:hypothetical protein